MEMVGKIAFYVGLVISVIAGWQEVGQLGMTLLVVLGLVVGVLNVSGKESSRFLIATLVLITVGLALRGVFGQVTGTILTAFTVFTAAAALVVALKEVYSIEKSF